MTDRHAQGPVEPLANAPNPLDPAVRIGHVHLRTASIDRVRDFYVGVLGFDVVAEYRDIPGWGTTGDALFISAGGYHHHLGFNTWKSKDGPPQPDGVTGLHHVALLYPTREALADAYRRLTSATGRSARPPITAPTRRSTSPTRTATTWSWPGTTRSPSGRWTSRAAWRASATTSTWTRCCGWRRASGPAIDGTSPALQAASGVESRRPTGGRSQRRSCHQRRTVRTQGRRTP